MVTSPPTGRPKPNRSEAASRRPTFGAPVFGHLWPRPELGLGAWVRVDVEHKFDQLVRERRLARIEPGDLD